MPDALSPLARVLQAEDRVYLGAPKSAAYWNTVAIAARRYLTSTKPPAPTERPACATCPYWHDTKRRDEGLCRRRAPGEDWGVTSPSDWCGDHPDFPAWIASRREGGR